MHLAYCMWLPQRIEFNGRDLGPGEIASLCAKAGGSQAKDSEAAMVTFESDEGASTALLLSNSLLEDRPIFLVAASSGDMYFVIEYDLSRTACRPGSASSEDVETPECFA